MSGQHSYPIIWTQSKFCFKWDIELLDNEERKIAQISTGLSEFKEGSMRHIWLVPPTIQNGDYLIKICENSAPETCGKSSSFFIRTTKGGKHGFVTKYFSSRYRVYTAVVYFVIVVFMANNFSMINYFNKLFNFKEIFYRLFGLIFPDERYTKKGIFMARRRSGGCRIIK